MEKVVARFVGPAAGRSSDPITWEVVRIDRMDDRVFLALFTGSPLRIKVDWVVRARRQDGHEDLGRCLIVVGDLVEAGACRVLATLRPVVTYKTRDE